MVGRPCAHTSGSWHWKSAFPIFTASSSARDVLNFTAFLHAYESPCLSYSTRCARSRRIAGGHDKVQSLESAWMESKYSPRSRSVVANPSIDGMAFSLFQPLCYTSNRTPVVSLEIVYPQYSKDARCLQAVCIWASVKCHSLFTETDWMTLFGSSRSICK